MQKPLQGLKDDGTLHPTVQRVDLYRELVNRLNGYFADRPENPFKPQIADRTD